MGSLSKGTTVCRAANPSREFDGPGRCPKFRWFVFGDGGRVASKRFRSSSFVVLIGTSGYLRRILPSTRRVFYLWRKRKASTANGNPTRILAFKRLPANRSS